MLKYIKFAVEQAWASFRFRVWAVDGSDKASDKSDWQETSG